MAQSPLHGRSVEVAVLEASLERAAAGTTQYAVIEGEPGIGKSRILEVALERARRRGFHVFLGRADELDHGRPFGPLAEALAWMPDSTEAAADAGLQFRLVDAFVDAVEQRALADPVAIGLDDLQWADSSTLLALRSLSRRPPLPVAILVTLRPLPRTAELDQLLTLLARGGAQQLVLEPLADEAVALLVADLVGAEPTGRLLEQVRGAAGNPLFVAELVDALVAEAAIEFVDGRAELREPVLPPSLRLTILRRLSFLDSEALELLRVAAALGATFSLHHVATVMGRATAALLTPVSHALRAGVLVERAERLAFRHDLVREAIYEDLPHDVRAALHLDAGRRLAAAGADALQVAEQLALGARPGDRDAVEWLCRAAREAAPGNPAGAIALVRRAEALLPDDAAVRVDLATLLAYAGGSGESERLAREVLAAPYDLALEGKLRAAIVQALLAEGRWSDLVSEVEAARTQPHVGERDRARLLAESALARIWLGELEEAAADAEESLRLGRQADDPVAVCFALGHLSSIADQRGYFTRGLQLARESLEVALHSGAAEAARRHPHIALGGALIAADRLREAREVLEEGRRLGERTGTVWDLPLYHSMLALSRYYLGEWDDALAEIEAGLALADEVGSGVGRVTALSLRGDIAVHRNELTTARDAIGEATEIVERFGPQWGTVWLTLARVGLLDATGESDHALAVLREAWDAVADEWVESALRTGPTLVRLAARNDDRELVRAVAAKMDEMAQRGDVPYARGGAFIARALAERDAESALAAVEAYRPSERAPELAAACEDAARLLAAGGGAAEARSFFDGALAAYEQLGAARDAARSLASMRELGIGRRRRGARKRPQRGWESLTPSERDVVRLAAEGLTNPEIGQRLFISRRTVETHLRHAFQKLDVSSRVELAAAVVRLNTP